jgi:hypothetical protein
MPARGGARVITVPQWCLTFAAGFRAVEPALVVPAQLVNDRDAAIVHATLRALAIGGPDTDQLLEDIDRIRAGHARQPQETR